MKKLLLNIVAAIILTTITMSTAQAGITNRTYAAYLGDDLVAEVFVTADRRTRNTIEHWVVYDYDSFRGIAPLPSPSPNPDKSPDPDKLAIEMLNIN